MAAINSSSPDPLASPGTPSTWSWWYDQSVSSMRKRSVVQFLWFLSKVYDVWYLVQKQYCWRYSVKITLKDQRGQSARPPWRTNAICTDILWVAAWLSSRKRLLMMGSSPRRRLLFINELTVVPSWWWLTVHWREKVARWEGFCVKLSYSRSRRITIFELSEPLKLFFICSLEAGSNSGALNDTTISEFFVTV